MARYLWSVPCLQVLTDRETNAVSLLNVVEGFQVRKLPGELPPVMVATLWRRERPGEKMYVQARLISPTEEELYAKKTDELNFGDFLHYRVNIQIAGVHVSQEGEYTIVLEYIAADDAGGESEPVRKAQFPLLLSLFQEDIKPRDYRKRVEPLLEAPSPQPAGVAKKGRKKRKEG